MGLAIDMANNEQVASGFHLQRDSWPLFLN